MAKHCVQLPAGLHDNSSMGGPCWRLDRMRFHLSGCADLQVAACRQELDVAQYHDVDEKYRVQVQPLVPPVVG